MAHYLRFEVYVPVEYKDSKGEHHSIDRDELRNFANETIQRFRGLTETNPVQAPPFRGWWKSTDIVVDLLIQMFVLVPQREQDEAVAFFTDWKARLEKQFYQEFILITFSPLQTIGQL